MLIKDLQELLLRGETVKGEGWESRRLLLAEDGLGYSFHDTLMREGAVVKMHYKHHIETVYCISGEAEVTNEETGEVHHIIPGMMYVLNNHERHTFKALTEFRDICIFTPALSGKETHDADGSYPKSQ